VTEKHLGTLQKPESYHSC